ncbi:MAG: hypothetical protein AAF322_10070 [Pseudomonadota bacterium]
MGVTRSSFYATPMAADADPARRSVPAAAERAEKKADAASRKGVEETDAIEESRVREHVSRGHHRSTRQRTGLGVRSGPSTAAGPLVSATSMGRAENATITSVSARMTTKSPGSLTGALTVISFPTIKTLIQRFKGLET